MTVVWPFANANELSQDRIETRLLMALLESMPEAAFMIEHGNRTVMACNSRAERMFGYRMDELLGNTTCLLHLSEDAYEGFAQSSQGILEHGQPFHGQLWMRRADGTCFPTEHTLTPLPNVGDQLISLSLVRDLSQKQPSTHFSRVFNTLTPRERDVFAYTARGLSAKEIARNLGLSHRTVEQHRNNILQKFQLRSVKQLLAEVATAGAIAQPQIDKAAERS
ncbi:LuxR C-terminal-related transcriptional regulator [Rhodovibrio salinarum]|uniref:PAS domain S-box-containing protein n=1 Tax=Rhodovibrio salinarum TaxID=1087 RepID=A0A934QJU4_9PROT|nr:LuxR C-terminal-related transcriptional regulator [Rhodovibrio salinarum]MBK1697997.1 hypothetical protein [Rhodovibrio salinarum]